MDELIEENMDLVPYMLKKYKLLYARDEYYDIAIIGLVQAGKYYSKDKGKFSTYACRCIANELNKEIARRKTLSRSAEILSLDYEISEDLTVIDTISSDINIEQDFIRKELAKLINEKIDMLNDRQKDIVKRHNGIHCKKETYKEIAKDYGITHQRIRSIELDAFRILRRELKNVKRDY